MAAVGPAASADACAKDGGLTHDPPTVKFSCPHHSRTFPCMSYRPKAFGSFSPVTFVAIFQRDLTASGLARESLHTLKRKGKSNITANAGREIAAGKGSGCS